MIRKEQVEEINQRFMTEKGLSESAETFRVNEPYIYSWMMTHAKALVASMAKKKTVDPVMMTEVYENMCRSYMFTYLLMTRNRDILVDKLIFKDQFQAFLDGKLDDRYYTYDTSGVSSDSDLVTAKNAYMRNALQTLRKRLLPLIAEDVGMGLASQNVLQKVEELQYGKA